MCLKFPLGTLFKGKRCWHGQSPHRLRNYFVIPACLQMGRNWNYCHPQLNGVWLEDSFSVPLPFSIPPSLDPNHYFLDCFYPVLPWHRWLLQNSSCQNVQVFLYRLYLCQGPWIAPRNVMNPYGSNMMDTSLTSFLLLSGHPVTRLCRGTLLQGQC